MNEIVEHETDNLIIKKLSQTGKRSIGRRLSKNICLGNKRVIKSNYPISDYKLLLDLFEYNAGIIILPEGDATKKEFQAYINSLADECYPFVASGYFLKCGCLFCDGSDTFSSDSLSVGFLYVSYEQLVDISNDIMRKFMIKQVLLKDENSEFVYLISKKWFYVSKM